MSVYMEHGAVGASKTSLVSRFVRAGLFKDNGKTEVSVSPGVAFDGNTIAVTVDLPYDSFKSHFEAALKNGTILDMTDSAVSEYRQPLAAGPV